MYHPQDWEERVSWEDYHPDARRILDDPFYWNSEYGPHWDDTGADMLAHCKEWAEQRSPGPARKFLARVLRSWDVEAIDWQVADERQLAGLNQDELIGLTICDDAVIALAFALIKLRGRCDSAIREMTLRAIDREALPVVMKDRAWTDPGERLRALAKMKEKLKALEEGE